LQIANKKFTRGGFDSIDALDVATVVVGWAVDRIITVVV
jgi:hypothetical protein